MRNKLLGEIVNNKYVIAISFANYLESKSGMPKVMMAHQQLYNNHGISYVSLFSVKKTIFSDRYMLFCKFGLIVDGEFKGIYQMSQLIHLFKKWEIRGYSLIDIHIHHLMYMNINLIEDLLMSSNDVPVKVYLHDYYNACTGYTLLKNNLDYCGGRGFSEQVCSGCRFYKQSNVIEPQIQALLRRNLGRITFISPSQTTKNIFLNFHPEFGERIIVLPHQIYFDHYDGNAEQLASNQTVRIGFLGMPRRHKGWETWSRLVSNCSGDGYQFIVFNSSNDSYANMSKVKVGFSGSNLNAMTDALRKSQIHVALLWSIWPETYSYTCFEAFSANAFIITNKNSGNIADVVRANNNGIVLENEKQLLDLFQDRDGLLDRINNFRKTEVGGPKQLYENDEIVRLSLRFSKKSTIKDSHRLVDYPLLWILNYLYNRKSLVNK